ncbi:hypothetical protein JZU54_03765, partial [bacterium]|nr:hypothetical protein [bacterium]
MLFDSPSSSEEEEEEKDDTMATKDGGAGAAAASSEVVAGVGGPKPRCRGVRLQDGCEVKVSEGRGAVLSTMGFIPTFLHLLP